MQGGDHSENCNIADVIAMEIDNSQTEQPLTSYLLSDDSHRIEFLMEVYWAGPPTFFAAASHLWDSLAEPKQARCTLIGAKSGAGGKGKTAILLTLKQFVQEALALDTPLPPRAEFETMEAWHEAAMASFVPAERVRQLAERYSAILDGSV